MTLGNRFVRLFTFLFAISSFVVPVHAKHKLPLPAQVLTAKTIFIDNQAGYASIGDKVYDELRKWGRYQVVDSPGKADIVLLLSAKEYLAGYTGNTVHNTTGTVNGSGQISSQTYSTGGSSAVYGGTTYITLIDPKSGDSLWQDARAWGRWKSATRGLVKELRDRVNEQEKK
jgi:hypothetical protein